MAKIRWVVAREHLQTKVPEVGDMVTIKYKEGPVQQEVRNVTKAGNTFFTENAAYSLRPNGRWVPVWCDSDSGPDVIIGI